MLANFCHPVLKDYTCLSTSSVAADNCELVNFQSSSLLERSRGFQVERFIKPPVDIFIRFQHPVNLTSIVVECGNEKAGLEVWTPVSPGDSASNTRNGKFAATYERRLSQARTSAASGSVVVFSSGQQQRTSSDTAWGSFIHSARLQQCTRVVLHQEKRFSQLSGLAIRVYFVAGATPAKLKLLELWGRPASSGWSAADRKQFDALVGRKGTSAERPVQPAGPGLRAPTELPTQSPETERNYLGLLPPRPSDANATGPGHAGIGGAAVVVTAGRASSPARKPHMGTGNVLQVGPEEFYDSITNEMMYTPVLLPSGNNVDATTLEKLAENDRRWGREPCDPFTGKTLTATYKAEVNGGLKVRIDSFLSKRNRYRDSNLPPGPSAPQPDQRHKPNSQQPRATSHHDSGTTTAVLPSPLPSYASFLARQEKRRPSPDRDRYEEAGITGSVHVQASAGSPARRSHDYGVLTRPSLASGSRKRAKPAPDSDE